MKKVEYIRVLDFMALIGRKDCEIFYITHKGNYNDLAKMAFDRNIIITSISKKEYETQEGKFKFAHDMMNCKDVDEVFKMLGKEAMPRYMA